MSTRHSLTIAGMSCGHCVARVTKTLAAQPGVHVHDVKVGSADLTLPDPTALDAVIAALDEAGFTARLAQE